MPVPKADFGQLYPCEFYEPADLLAPDLMYTVEEIARLLQGLAPDEALDADAEDVLVDWTIPWIVANADDLVIADPRTEEEPGYYGLREDVDGGGSP